MKTINQIDAEKCLCLEDNKLAQSLCSIHKKSLPIEIVDAEVRAATIASVPEIMELKSGCRANYSDANGFRAPWCSLEHKNVMIVTGNDWNTSDEVLAILVDRNMESLKFVPKSCLEILGRPITIADVLRAIDYDRMKPKITFDISGEEINESQVDFERKMIGILRKWNLSKSYEDQSEETKRFLHSVICKK